MWRRKFVWSARWGVCRGTDSGQNSSSRPDRRTHKANYRRVRPDLFRARRGVAGPQLPQSVQSPPFFFGLSLGPRGGSSAAAIIGKLISQWGVPGGPVNRWVIGVGTVPRGEVGSIFAGSGSGLNMITEAQKGHLNRGRVDDLPPTPALEASPQEDIRLMKLRERSSQDL